MRGPDGRRVVWGREQVVSKDLDVIVSPELADSSFFHLFFEFIHGVCLDVLKKGSLSLSLALKRLYSAVGWLLRLFCLCFSSVRTSWKCSSLLRPGFCFFWQYWFLVGALLNLPRQWGQAETIAVVTMYYSVRYEACSQSSSFNAENKMSTRRCGRVSDHDAGKSS